MMAYTSKIDEGINGRLAMVDTGVQTLMKRRRERLQALLEQLAQHRQRLWEYLATPGILGKETKLSDKKGIY